MIKQFLSEEEAFDTVKDVMEKLQGRRWMIAIWAVDETDPPEKPNLLTFVGKCTWGFPVGDYDKCLAMLKEDMDAQVRELLSNPPEAPALPAAGDGEQDVPGFLQKKDALSGLFQRRGQGKEEG